MSVLIKALTVGAVVRLKALDDLPSHLFEVQGAERGGRLRDRACSLRSAEGGVRGTGPVPDRGGVLAMKYATLKQNTWLYRRH